MLQEGVLEPVDQPVQGSTAGCSWLAGWRPVIDLSALHGFVMLTKFKMGTLASVLGSVRERDWMFSIDLRDAYFQIPVHLESRPYLRFFLRGMSTSSVPCVSVCPWPRSVHQTLRSGSRVGALEGYAPSSLPG